MLCGVYIYGVSDISEFAIIVFGMSFVLIKVMEKNHHCQAVALNQGYWGWIFDHMPLYILESLGCIIEIAPLCNGSIKGDDTILAFLFTFIIQFKA